MEPCIWSKLPDDLFGHIVSRLPLEAIIRSRTVCQSWNTMITSQSFINLQQQIFNQNQPWFLMCSAFNCRDNCCAYNPNSNTWHSIPLTFLPDQMRFPLTSVGGFLFIKGSVKDCNSSSTSGQLVVCNPVSKTWRTLPPMNRGRVKAVVGVVEDLASRSFKIIVAGGTSENGGDYECTTEIYDSVTDAWRITGPVTREYTVKTTIWTSKTVSCNGVLYCLTSARPYNIMAYDMSKGIWEEVNIPQPEMLFRSFLLQRRGRLLLVGGAGSGRVCNKVRIWELENGDGFGFWQKHTESQKWVQIEQMPDRCFKQFAQNKTEFDLKCAGCGDMLYFFKDSHSDVLLCDLTKNPADWRWLPASPLSKYLNFSVTALLMEPRLDYVAAVIQQSV